MTSYQFSVSQIDSSWYYLTLYDGSNDQSNQIETLVGNLGSFNVSSSGNSLFVKFYGEGRFLATIHYGNPHFNIFI